MNMHFVNEFIGDGILTEDDIENVKHHASNGNEEAMYHLALMYDTGNNMPRNPIEAEKWYKLAVEKNHAAAMYFLARLYSTQNSGIRRDEKEAQKLYKMAAEHGYEDAIKVIAN